MLTEYEMISNLFTEVKNTTHLVWIIAFIVFINFLMEIVKIFASLRLKNKEKTIFTFTAKEKRRIEVTEDLYKKMEKLTNYIDKSDEAIFIEEIRELDKFVSINKLYIDKKVSKLVQEFSDYEKKIFADFRKKDFKVESDYLEEIIKLFNK